MRPGSTPTSTVETEPDPNGVVLVFRTTEQWFVGPVSVEGKLKLPPNEGQLANASRLEFGAPFDDENLQSATRGMRDLLQRNGLYLSKVEPKTERDAEHQQIAFTFHVDAGKRARLTLPEITGETRLPAEEVAKAAKYKGWFRWKPATEENTQRGVRNIRAEVQQEGPADCFRHPRPLRLSARRESRPSHDRGQWRPQGQGGGERREGFQGQAGEVRSGVRRGDGQSRPAGPRSAQPPRLFSKQRLLRRPGGFQDDHRQHRPGDRSPIW